MEHDETGRQFEDDPAHTAAHIPAGTSAEVTDLPSNFAPEYALDDLPEGDTRFWTRRRILLTIIAILMVAALLAYSLPGLFLPPPPTPTPLPAPLI